MVFIGDDTIRLQIEPDLGASWRGLTVFRRDEWIPLTRPSPRELTRSTQAASYSMFPYSNRIRDGRFSFEGVTYQLRGSENHALHGDVRDRPWRTVPVEPEPLRDIACSFAFDSRDFPDFDYPFPMSVGVTWLAMRGMVRGFGWIRNDGKRTMPFGGGFHPYFLRDPAGIGDDLQLRFRAPRVYDMEPGTPLPVAIADVRKRGLDFRRPRFVPFGLDHCFGGWDGRAILNWPKSGISLRIHTAPAGWFDHLVVYSPAGKSFVAIEPAANANDGFNLGSRLSWAYPIKTLAAGASVDFEVSFEVHGITAR
ncbi:MAG: hypothetical protein KJ042_17945 [Deltaproteobacteria bacterium]|nr:hypothetical protein [Deltaproteobacteria bacterium]